MEDEILSISSSRTGYRRFFMADRIYVLDKGRIIDAGTYEELVHRDGWFSRHANLQLA